MKYRKTSREIETTKKTLMEIPDKTTSTQNSTFSENHLPRMKVK